MVCKKKNVIIFTTDTLHHRYLIKKINYSNRLNLSIILEKKTIKQNFTVGTIQNSIQTKFEKKYFFNNTPYEIKNKIYNVSNINSSKCIRIIKKIKPKAGVLFGTGKASKKIINLFKNKLINIHRGMMQKYRGLDSELWASYYEDFNSIGTTIHFVNKYLDKGQIILEKKIKLKKNMRAYQLRYYTTLFAGNVIVKILEDIINRRKYKAIKQLTGRYYSVIPFDLKKIAYKNFDNYCSKLYV